MLDPHRLRVFRSVVASGGVQAAADNLGMTSSAVSQHLAALARETGLVLFERRGRGLEPTPAARVLVAETHGVMDGLSRLDEVVADLRSGRSGRLTLGYFGSAGRVWLPRVVAQLAAEMPDLTVELVLTEGVGRGPMPDIDLVVDGLTEAGRITRVGYRRVELADDPYVAVVPSEDELATRTEVALTELAGRTWVSNDDVRSVGHRLLVQGCAAAGFTPRFRVQAQDQYTAIAFVAAGVGITVLPRLASTPHPRAVSIVPVASPAPYRRIAALVRVDGPANPAAARAMEILTSSL